MDEWGCMRANAGTIQRSSRKMSDANWESGERMDLRMRGQIMFNGFNWEDGMTKWRQNITILNIFNNVDVYAHIGACLIWDNATILTHQKRKMQMAIHTG